MLNTAKLAGSIDREVRTLGTNLDECVARLVTDYPHANVTVSKVPGRLILQAGGAGVSISMFRSRAGADATAEVMLSVWQGEITIPGTAPRQGQHASQVSARQFHIIASGDALWLWCDDATTNTMTSDALAAVCIEPMEQHLRLSNRSRQSPTARAS